MKKLYFFLMLLPGFALAQIINIPDPAFKSMLLSSGLQNVAYNSDGLSLTLDSDHDGEISVQEIQNVDQLDVRVGGISDLTGIEFFNNMTFLLCSENSLTTLDVSMLGNLEQLYCKNNSLTSLIINPNLQTLQAQNNLLTSLDLTNHLVPFVAVLLDDNLLTSLTVHSVEWLRVSNNPITTLNLTGQFNDLQIAFTPMTTLDLSQAQITQNGRLLFYDTPLQFLNLKNGYDESGNFDLTEVSNESVANLYICADENEIAGLNAQIESVPVDNWMIGSYCSFTPGGYYNTISGTAHFDSNNNGCDSEDIQCPMFKVTIDDGNETGTAFTNNLGVYHFFTNDGEFTLTPAIENAAWFNFSPPNATVNFPSNDHLTATQDFCMTANGVHPDVEIAIVPFVAARPGFDAVYKIVYKNKGNQTLSGNAVFFYEEPLLDFVSASPAPDQVLAGSIGFNYTNLLPFESRTIMVTLGVNAPTDTPPVNDGDLLHFTALINPASGDETPADNNFALTQMAVNSVDPNHKTCLEGEYIDQEMIGHYLHYNISFENVGTADAINVVVKDILDSNKFDLSTLQILDSSHPMRAQLNGNKLEFIFENINLPPSNLDPIGGHGNVLFKIKTLATLQIGDIVTNTAHIYFDYNHPIETNQARTAFSTLKAQEFTTDKSVQIYPNPAKNRITIKAQSAITNVSLFDVQGRVIETKIGNHPNMTLDVSGKQNGLYLLKITTEQGTKVEKIVKE
ncbi:T9SS type A sorting domain-containing protein [Flavobacterium sp.]|uniref:DUF7619 domain-containing protein n=1 Tax=Flavobacterium sp. TaxID=239 RepID=UPI0039E3487D